MSYFEINIPVGRDAAEAVKELPYSVWLTVDEGKKIPSETTKAWVTYGEATELTGLGYAKDGDLRTQVGDRHPFLQQVAKAHRDRIDGKSPTFTLFARSAPLRPLCSVQPTAPGKGEKEAYVVKDARGSALCRISRGRSRLGLRRTWRIEPEGSGETFVGYRGTWPGWLLFMLFLPLWIPLTVVSVAVAALESGGSWDSLTWEPPHHTVWRSRSGAPLMTVVLDYRRDRYRWNEAHLDVRIAYAQAVLNHIR